MERSPPLVDFYQTQVKPPEFQDLFQDNKFYHISIDNDRLATAWSAAGPAVAVLIGCTRSTDLDIGPILIRYLKNH